MDIVWTIVVILIIIAVGVSVLETQNTALSEYCLNLTGKTNWTVEECNITVYNSNIIGWK